MLAVEDNVINRQVAFEMLSLAALSVTTAVTVRRTTS